MRFVSVLHAFHSPMQATCLAHVIFLFFFFFSPINCKNVEGFHGPILSILVSLITSYVEICRNTSLGKLFFNTVFYFLKAEVKTLGYYTEEFTIRVL